MGIAKIYRTVLLFVLLPFLSSGQGFLSNLQVNGNFQLDLMYYQKDSLIGAPDVPEKVLFNGFGNINFTLGHFSAGFRFESYLYALQGFDPRYKGTGIPYRYASYQNDNLEITLGSFYEQFGNGLIFRSYEERDLGFDNALDGFRVRYTPFKGVTVKGVIGLQRFFFSKGPGTVRGIDAELNFNQLIKKWESSKVKFSVGGSFVSKFQKDEDPVYILPQNVGAWAGRADLGIAGFYIGGEYAYKINDPSAVNNRIYKAGEALLLQARYSRKGFGVYVAAKRIDNMNFRSDRDAIGNALLINYLPALTRQHLYSLSALYPYATQPNGEVGVQAQVIYTIKKGTKLGGKYGTSISINYSRANSIDKQRINELTPLDSTGTLGYKSNFFSIGKERYFEDINIEISRKFGKKIKTIFSYVNIAYNVDVIEGHYEGMVYANIGILDLTYNFKPTRSLRTEIQYLYTKQDEGEWIMGLLELSVAPKWFFSIHDQYNYGNQNPDLRVHYYGVGFAYTRGTSRIQLNYGRQNDGILCVGGVCRYVPAANGLTLSITSSF